ncbi:LysR family transcriptional regulator [Achromobacter xylosoxidans]|uniref:LysR family transcriptional regulator n=1 Tax=Alcaligenes xylosoxydans xylosoxydans TaxID=85698 RepID=UPI0022B8BBF3|nr:LysR family transcriptional regulator [Achromobacter xylosoxidans]MCZ8389561.1 LysR family transcriptional regulator [Achromobacter xylosoxidans]
MDLRQLRYFVVLANQEHFGKAASVLHVAQPALTRQIRLLEEELGVQLFVRHSRGASPTEEAAFLLERAAFLLRYAEQLKQDMSALQRNPSGPIAIGIAPGLAMTLAAPLTRAVRERLPDVRLRFVQAFSPALHDMLLKGQVDLAILNGPVPLANLTTYPFLTEGLSLIGPARDKKARTAAIPLQRLADAPLIMTGLAKSGVRLELEAQAAHAGVHLNPVVEVETIEVAKRLIRDGVGMTVHFAATVLEDIEEGRLSAQPIDCLSLRRILAHPSDRPASRATKAMVEILRQVARDLVAKKRWPHARLDF